MSNKLFIKLTRETLPQIKEKFPFIYLEAGRLEVDDSSVKWIDSTGNVVRLPIATISALLLGFGTTVTHAAVKACASANCTLCWVGEDSLLFYASGMSPTSNTTNKILTSANAALYSLISSVVFSLGYSPYIGFVHSGSPLPFIYDLADLYKEHLTIDMAFSLTKDMAVYYDKYILLDDFRKRVIEARLLENLADDINKILTVK